MISAQATGVTVVGIERNLGLLAVDTSTRFPTFLDDLQNAGLANFDQDVILEARPE